MHLAGAFWFHCLLDEITKRWGISTKLLGDIENRNLLSRPRGKISADRFSSDVFCRPKTFCQYSSRNAHFYKARLLLRLIGVAQRKEAEPRVRSIFWNMFVHIFLHERNINYGLTFSTLERRDIKTFYSYGIKIFNIIQKCFDKFNSFGSD